MGIWGAAKITSYEFNQINLLWSQILNNFSVNDTAPKVVPAHSPTAEGLYILALTAEILSPEMLKSIVQIGDDVLRKKNPAFARLLGEQMQPDTPIIVANILFAGALMHTPQTM